MKNSRIQTVVGVILAGGRSRRMGGDDKSLALLNGEPLVQRAIARLEDQVSALVISANGPADRYARFGRPVVADAVPGFAGPLAGILRGLTWARENISDASHVATVAVDTPFFPLDLVARLSEAGGETGIAVAQSGGRLHPVFALVPSGVADNLAVFIAEGSTLKVADWLAQHAVTAVSFDMTAAGVDPFFNINRPDDLARAAAIAAGCAGL